MKKIFYAGIFFISTFSGLFFGCGVVYADTQVPAEIGTDMTWGIENSPYLVKGDVKILKDVTLTIQPGVSIKFESSESDFRSSMTILGSLKANGTLAAPIKFSPIAAANDWALNFIGSTSTLSYVNLEDSNNEILNPFLALDSNLKIDHLITKNLVSAVAFNNSVAEISKSNFGNGGTMLEVFNHSDVSVSDSSFHDVSTQSYNAAVTIYNEANVSLENVSVENITSGDALEIFNNANVTLSSTTITQGQGNGVMVYNNAAVSLKNSKVNNFAQDGIQAYSGAKISLDHSIVVQNNVGLEMYSSPIYFDVSSSSINSNKTYGILNYSDDIINATNVWWGDAAGPATYVGDSNDIASDVKNVISNNVDFAPWLTSDPLILPKCCSSVAFIPGLEGSRLYIPATLYGENQLWEPNRNADVEKLYMDTNGNSIRGDVYTKDIIDESKIGGLNIYKKFEQSMDDLVTGKVIKEWKALPYDWRKGVSGLVTGGTVIKNDQGNFDVLNFVKEIEHLAASSTTGKTTIIAHSNGGLIAKQLVQELVKRNEVDLVDKVILVAVPELGTPKSIPALLNGYDQGFAWGVILEESIARGLGQNMQSAYNLLPSKEYFNRVADPVVVFDSLITATSSPFVYLGQNGTKLNSFDQLQSFLLGQKDNRKNPEFNDTYSPIILNSKLLSSADITHTALDSWQYPVNIEVSQVAGWGLDTLSGTKYTLGKDCGMNSAFCSTVIDAEPIFTSDGDNTVVTSSATAINTNTYYVNLPAHNAQLLSLRRNRGHADILEISELQQLLKNIIISTSTVAVPDLITTTKPLASAKQSPSLHIGVHSPVSIDAYDRAGNHTGLVPNPDPNSDLQLVEENIPNSYYLNFGEGKYIGIPTEAGVALQLQGTGYGTFTLDVGATTFTDIPVTPMTVAHINNSASTTPQLSLDVEGDGKDDYILQPNKSFDPILYLESLKQTVVAFNLKKSLEKDLLTKIDKVISLVKKGKIDKAETKIQKLIFRAQKKKSKKIADADKEQFVTMLNQLLTNLN